MSSNKKYISYHNQSPYETLNTLTDSTENIWVVLHGMGYLSRYFLKHFKQMDTDTNYLIAPQAPSKYYLKDDFKHVGASWLTKEDTQLETTNVLNYLDMVLKNEKLPENKNLILFGFSQGVSIAMRWWTQRMIPFNQVVLYAGGLPNEIAPKDTEFIDGKKTKIQLVYGDQDKYITQKRLQMEKEKIKKLFGHKAEVIEFSGKHEILPEVLDQLL